VVERELALSGEVLAEKYKDRLESSYRVIYLLIFKKSFIHLKMDPSTLKFYFYCLYILWLMIYVLCLHISHRILFA